MSGFRICSPAALTAYVHEVCRAMGTPDEIAAEVARHLVRANLSGHDSHGVLRLPQYVRQADQGGLVPAARPTLLSETASTALMDAERGFGQYSTTCALAWAMAHARAHGIAAVAVRHSTHIGRLGEYTERASAEGLIGMVTIGTAAPGTGGVAPFGGRERFLGTNPWSIGIPAKGSTAMVYDAATSVVAEGKVRLARAKEASVPLGWIVDRNGVPSTKPDAYYAGGALVPLGGELAGHKGYGLSLAAALLGGLAMIDDPEPMFAVPYAWKPLASNWGMIGGVFLIVMSPAAFGNADRYQTLTGDTLAAAKRVPPASGVAGVLVPGEPELRTRRERERAGIRIPAATWQELAAVGARFGVSIPEADPV